MKAIEEFFSDEANLEDNKKLQETFGIYPDEKKNLFCFIDSYNQGILQKYIEVRKEHEEYAKKINGLNALRDTVAIYSYDTKGSQVLQLITNYNVPKGQLAKYAELKNPQNPEECEYTESISLGEECPFEDGTILHRKVYKSGTSYSDEKMANSDAPQKYIVKNGNIYPAEKKGDKYIPNKKKKIKIDDTVLTFYKP